MDDPWGSPWAADESPPKIDLSSPPTAPPPPAQQPQRPHVDDNGLRQDSPWDNDNLWGGWNDRVDGADSPGWGRSPGLTPTHNDQDILAPGLDESRITDSAITLWEPQPKSDHKLPTNLMPKETPADQYPDIHLAPDESSQPQEYLDASELHDDTSQHHDPWPKTDDAAELEQDQRPEATRQSSKVQVLVQMYDDISQQATPPASSPIHESRADADDDDEDDEYERASLGHIQSPVKEPEEFALDNSGIATQAKTNKADRPPTPQAKSIHPAPASTIQQEEPASIPEPVQISQPNTTYDPSLLDKLFPSTPHAAPTAPEPLPDNIIDDTFRTGSERKAWYLLSRPGSLRKHDLGSDDDAYVHVTWPTSHAVRERTLRIVRRWMEEDSIAGRVVWGARGGAGGGGGGSGGPGGGWGAVGARMFGWDSQAPDVGIGELLAQQRRKGREKDGARPQSLMGVAGTDGAGSLGWNGSVPVSPVDAVSPAVKTSQKEVSTQEQQQQQPVAPAAPAKRAVNIAPLRPQSWNGTLMPSPKSAPLQPSARHIATPETNTGQSEDGDGGDDVDDDDDWGEMISSPMASDFDKQDTIIPGRGEQNQAKRQFAHSPLAVVTPSAPEDAVAPSSAQATPTSTATEPKADTSLPAAPTTTMASKPSFPPPRQTTIAEKRASSTLASMWEAGAPALPHTATAPQRQSLESSIASPVSVAATTAEDDAVADILRGLPDLTYMMR